MPKRRKRRALKVGSILRTVGIGADTGVIQSCSGDRYSVRWASGGTHAESKESLKGAKVVGEI